jgi:hypothetical protein
MANGQYLQEKYGAKHKFSLFQKRLQKNLRPLNKPQKLIDINQAYKDCLTNQVKYAFTDEKAYFKVYSHLLAYYQLPPGLLFEI